MKGELSKNSLSLGGLAHSKKVGGSKIFDSFLSVIGGASLSDDNVDFDVDSLAWKRFFKTCSFESYTDF